MLSNQTDSVSLRDLLDQLETGSRPKGGVKDIADGVPSIGAEHLDNDGGFDLSNIKYIPLDYAQSMRRGKIKQNDILIVKDGATTGKVSYVTCDYPYPESYVNEHVFICRPADRILGRYLFYYLRSQAGNDQIMATFHGGAQGGINSRFADEVSVPYIPKTEQQLIVDKLDATLPKIKQVKERLGNIPVLLKKFRQSVLAAACSGKLTEDWRDTNSCTLEWNYKTLEEVARSVSTGPFGSMLHQSDYIYDGIPVINPSNIKENNINPDWKNSVSKAKADELGKYRLQVNDIIVSRRGDLSKCGIVSPKEENWLAGTGVFIIRTDMDPYFFRFQFQSDYTQRTVQQNSLGSTMPNLNQRILNELEILVPPKHEQQEIVNRVAKLFSLADSIQDKYQRAMAKIAKLEQSVLAKAFRGELVGPNLDGAPGCRATTEDDL